MEKTVPSFVPVYYDLRFRLPMALFISLLITAHGGTGFFASLLVPVFYLELAATLAFTILIMEWINYVTRRLDQVWSWMESPFRRLGLQILLGVVVPSIVEFFLATLWFAFFGVNILDTTYLNFAYRPIVLLIITFNAYYFTHYLYLVLKKSGYKMGNTPANPRHPDFANEGIKVKKAGKKIILRWGDIRLFFHQDRYNYVAVSSGAKYIVPWSLDLLEEMLMEKDFFRLNRKLIAHRSACRNWSEIEKRKLKVELEPPVPDNLWTVVSQKKALGFKKWLSKGGIVN